MSCGEGRHSGRSSDMFGGYLLLERIAVERLGIAALVALCQFAADRGMP